MAAFRFRRTAKQQLVECMSVAKEQSRNKFRTTPLAQPSSAPTHLRRVPGRYNLCRCCKAPAGVVSALSGLSYQSRRDGLKMVKGCRTCRESISGLLQGSKGNLYLRDRPASVRSVEHPVRLSRSVAHRNTLNLRDGKSERRCRLAPRPGYRQDRMR